jgi:transcriptional regulator of acetoin/glycerol metabolism
LRVIETGQVTPIGGADPRAVDVRWIAATNRDLFAEPCGFREDLLRRLAGYVARVPPLRARREDLGELTAHLLRDAGIASASITAPAGRALFASALPGNVRQLRTTLRSAAILAGDAPIDVHHLPAPEPATPAAEAERGSIDDKKAAAPTAADITAALTAAGGNVVRAAAALGAHPRQLYRWIERFAIDLSQYRD